MRSVALFCWNSTELGMILELNTLGVAIFKRCSQRTADEPSQTSEAATPWPQPISSTWSVGSMARVSAAQANRSEILVAMLGHYP